SLPDIDIDFCFRKRERVIDYVTEKYGRPNVAQIITFGTMAARAVLRDAGRGLDIPYAEVDKIAKLIPQQPGQDITIAGALAEVTGQRPDIDALTLDDPAVYELFGKARTAGIFQFESEGMKNILRRLKPDRFEDLVAINALYRPGPIGGGLIDDFIKRRHGKV